MAYDGFVTAAVVKQLQNTIIGGRIDKIYQPEKEELLLLIHGNGTKIRLLLSANGGNARVHLTENEYSNPENPSAFCMLLRKHFQGGKIAEVQQVGSERIIAISVEHLNEMGFPVQKTLFTEIMGKHSNIIAVDQETGKIIDSIKRISPDISRVRQLLPGLPYLAPPDQGKRSFYDVDEAYLATLLSNMADLEAGKALLNGVTGLSPAISSEICYLAKGTTSLTLDSASLFSALSGFVKALDQPKESIIYEDSNGIPVDFHVFPLHALEGSPSQKLFPGACEAVDYFFSHRDSANRVRQKSSDLVKTVNAALDKLLLKKQRLCEDLLRAEDADIFRLYGELLTTALHQIDAGAEKANVLNYYDGKVLEIPLDSKISGAKNAQRYYKKYGKAKTAIKEKNIQLEEVSESIEYLESVLSFAENASSLEEMMLIRDELSENGFLRKRKDKYQPSSKTKIKPCTLLTSDGFKILVGRNNKENDRLTFKTADKRDLWFHTKDIPGSHVILVTEGSEASGQAILEAASAAAYYSKARSSENVPVDYVKIRHVKKPTGAKPGKVIFTDNRTVYVTPQLPSGEKK
ncbi:MAG: NFACT RNA binding domain-containing protein [Eubacteriales bacterium]|nr:NFACT RNA binding domain-containing protein [Eubacteriales bacterium]MDD3349893.1 NFACT RNA binding domain-containing protein [Eubacteriales bacterium]